MSTISTSAWSQDPAVQRLTRCNPLHGNPLRTREDMHDAIRALHEPLLPWYSPGGARLRFGVSGAHYGAAAAEMECFARPLWGLAALAGGGGEFEGSDLYVRGLDAGTDPQHPEYWGDVARHDQRMVEMACIANSILLAPKTFWDPMPEAAKRRAADWLRSINAHSTINNNWLFFRVLTNLALRSVGEEWSEDLVRDALDRLDRFYLSDGYYRDGDLHQLDYYTPMGMHYYGLMVARFAPDLFSDYASRFRERAHLFARNFEFWFADDGAAIPFGRSMIYRFAQGAFWAACAFADEEVVPWGRMKGLVLRHLRWWSNQPIADRDGILSIGYAYPNQFVTEFYNAPGSPYWALKIFLAAALPDDHPFWASEEEDAGPLGHGEDLSRIGGFAVRREPGNAVMLTGGQDGRDQRARDGKYARFAYSSAFGFSLASDSWGPDRPEYSAVDSGLMISRDGRLWESRNQIEKAGVDGDLVWGRWTPAPSTAIETWLAFAGPGWHVRVHRVETDGGLQLAEGGFAVDRTGDGHISPDEWFTLAPGLACVRSLSAVSALRDLSGTRASSVIRAAPNTNLMVPRTFFPRLHTSVPAGITVLVTAAFGVPRPDAAMGEPVLPASVRSLLKRLSLERDAESVR